MGKEASAETESSEDGGWPDHRCQEGSVHTSARGDGGQVARIKEYID